ncbi:hypothetical protein SDC9_152007 [bioreactor metagenome]|uniref:Uncharacterized protein n=1 Tax=bioreactor metagenome TaxID=1076179 RepID=A0A645ETK8_9ZZZZ
MKNNCRFKSFENQTHFLLITDVSDNYPVIFETTQIELVLQMEHRCLGLIDTNQHSWMKFAHLTNQFASDRSGSTSDQHHFAGNLLPYLVIGNLNHVSFKKFFDIDFADLFEGKFSVYPTTYRGYHQYFCFILQANLSDFAFPGR